MLLPLYKLAENNLLPEHQFMDVETLEWISNNIPTEIANINYRSIINNNQYFQNLVHFIPRNEWYCDEKIAKGIHGILHSYRVTTYLIILNNLLSLNIKEPLLIVVGMLHDIGRLNDRSDKEHGARSAIWINNNKELIENYLGSTITEKNWKNIMLAVSLHTDDSCIDEYTASEIKNIIKVLKTADALDRYRLPKVEWWIDKKYLTLKPNLAIMAFAFKFIVFTEKNNLKKIELEKTIKCFLQI